MVERYRMTGYDFGTEPHSDGAWVAYHAYAALKRQIAELRAERDEAKRRLFPYADATEICGYSTTDIYLIGDRKSIKAAEKAFHYSAQIEEYRAAFNERIAAAEAENARLSEANRKLHRRAQGAEGLLQNASNVAREQIETLESVATKAGHWPAGSHWAKRAMERWLESVLSGSTQPALPLKDEVERVLEPFAKAADSYDPPEDDDRDVAWAHDFTLGHLRAARSLLSRLRAGEQEGCA